MNNDNPSKASKKRDLVFIRVFDAPSELVWKVWTDPQRVKAIPFDGKRMFWGGFKVLVGA